MDFPATDNEFVLHNEDSALDFAHFMAALD